MHDVFHVQCEIQTLGSDLSLSCFISEEPHLRHSHHSDCTAKHINNLTLLKSFLMVESLNLRPVICKHDERQMQCLIVPERQLTFAASAYQTKQTQTDGTSDSANTMIKHR